MPGPKATVHCKKCAAVIHKVLPDGLCGKCRQRLCRKRSDPKYSHRHGRDGVLVHHTPDIDLRTEELAAKAELHETLRYVPPDDMTPEQERLYREQHCTSTYGNHGGSRDGHPHTSHVRKEY